MSRTGARRRTPAELIWGWGENGNRHPGILERIEKVEQALSKQTRLLWLIFLAVGLSAGQTSLPALIKALEQAVQIAPYLSSVLSAIH